jgi:hypothetical protein
MTTTRRAFRTATTLGLITTVLGTTAIQPALAAVISTDDLMASTTQQSSQSPIEQVLAREDVRAQLVSLGVDPEVAKARIATLSNEELAQINQRIDELPAGAGVIGILGVLFLVLLVLELIGVTNVFSKI